MSPDPTACPPSAAAPRPAPAAVEDRDGVDAQAAESARRAAELRALLEVRAGERHVVAIQDYPDPDAIGSAMAYREMARPFGIEVDVMYEGTISHPENVALVNLLRIPLIRFGPDADLAAYAAAVFVDNQGATTRLTDRLADAGVPTLAVIDHHDPADLLDPLFSDVRPVAAAATLITEYLMSGELLTLDPGDERHVHLATALMHGLHSETEDFVRARPPEYHAAAFLSLHLDPDLLERVLCVQKSRGTMEVIEAALGRRTVAEGFSVAGVGPVRWSDRDAIPQAAEFLLREENVHTVVVYGLVEREDGREVVSGSLRTSRAALGVDEFLRRALGSDVEGRPYGGGRSYAGGFEVDVGFLDGDEESEEEERMKWELFDRRIRRRIFDAAGIDPGVGEPPEPSV